jgi:Prolyl oligopeptidase, N-terminal beta-propeller domain
MDHVTPALLVCACGLSFGLPACTSSEPGALDPQAGPPPVADKRPKTITAHGDLRVDDYFWLNDKGDPHVMAYLKAEDAYAEAVMKPTAAFQNALYEEMVGHIKETDDTVPYRRGDYFYYSRTIAGQQYPVHCRKHLSLIAPEEIWIQQIGGAALRLTNGEREYSHLSFSPDDTRIIFTAIDDSGPNVYEVPTLGGEPRLLQRGASRGSISPDGLWLACVPRDAAGIQVAARGGAGFRTVASAMVDVACATWLPDSRSVLVHARPDPAVEADWWIVPMDGRSPTNTGLVQRFRDAGMFTVPTGAAWVDDSLVFSAAGAQGVSLYRQRLAASTFQPAGAPERLTAGTESTWLPTAAAGRLAFLSVRADANLWSVALDAASGIANGPLRRMTRGPAPLGFLTVTNDFRTLVYFSFRFGGGDIFLRDLRTDGERVLSEGPAGAKGYPAISPSGSLLAYGMRMPGGGRALRPIFVVCLPGGAVASGVDGTPRKLGDDCGGRPREWVDERQLIIESFARLNSIALIDTETADQHELLEERRTVGQQSAAVA